MGALPDANRSVPAAQRVHSPRCLKSEKRTSTAPMGSTANAIASSPGSIAIGGTTEPVMMISPPRSRSPKAASTSATCRTMSTHLPVLACGSLVRANSRPRRRTRQTRPSAALPVRAGAAPASHVALIDVAAEDALRIRGRLCDIDDLDRRRDAGNRGFGGGMISARRKVAADMNGDLRLGHGLGPAGERYVCSGMNECLASQESDQRSANVEPLEHLRRSEADLPAQRCVAAVEALAP